MVHRNETFSPSQVSAAGVSFAKAATRGVAQQTLPKRASQRAARAALERCITRRVGVEEFRSGVVLPGSTASSSNDAILPIRSSEGDRDPPDRDPHSDHAAFANTSENQLERALSSGADGAKLC
jgi:hypothetical protein